MVAVDVMKAKAAITRTNPDFTFVVLKDGCRATSGLYVAIVCRFALMAKVVLETRLGLGYKTSSIGELDLSIYI